MAKKFIPFNKFREIQDAAKNGNATAKGIIDCYLSSDCDMDRIDRLLGEYYGSQEKAEAPVEEIAEALGNPTKAVVKEETPAAVSDAGSDIGREIEGLIDEDDLGDFTFADYLEGKKRDALRAKKGSDYFKSFSEEDRKAFLDKDAEESEKASLPLIKKAERAFRDLDGSIDVYAQFASDRPDDEAEFDGSKAAEAYESLVGDESLMSAFGRSWDEDDVSEVKAFIEGLVPTHGKKNVVAALNSIKDDARAWKDHRLNQIDDRKGRRRKALESLLK